jgi:hypothetical protein
VGPKSVDRTVREVDVIEHVIKGVRPERRRGDELTSGPFHSWLGGAALSHVRVHVVPDDESDPDER